MTFGEFRQKYTRTAIAGLVFLVIATLFVSCTLYAFQPVEIFATFPDQGDHSK